jgi:hypothetical protein
MLRFIRRLTATSTDAPYVGTDAPLPTDPLGRPTVAWTVATGTRQQLSATCRRISVRNTADAAANYALGGSGVTASANSHDIGPGERLDIEVDPGEHIAAFGGTLRVSELG